ncbi:hypothetical protein [Pseudomonas amygdali]|uniref:Uncharacterized protein n=2 Tax=Pseudomonas amygdali pv. lachrymans TaxID=53707 RepID=A0ABR5KQ27_PSEAV|nr:hypothetical protein [Pseudomonas amygdali]AXH59466.1 hypothetical protein PLA107_030020 [Pseudomonas amygdali pv. lachrymans str. M301315]KPC16894.1 Uncharacterized protein AC499_0096 [Pseudomonas amygdali pv. lachrymans]KPC17853.1 Uncharacterized protein AC499_1055 [Pseudomonas amygdali pv. lachrymans]RMT06299.1 hypothetical protein ALP54_03394 [Pseudomonas amygdali pv. lachrymans]
MLLEALNNKTWKDEYKIHAWSYEQGQEILLATITLDQNKQLVVKPSDAGAPLYARMGLLPTNSNDAYSLDLAEAPATLVATALGLPGNSQSFLRGLQEDLGHYPGAYDMLEVALRGHPEQSGRLNASGSEDRVLKIPVNHFVDLMADNTGAPKDLYVRHQEEYQGMTKSSVLAKNGSLIIPAYLVTVDSDPHANANDRLAIYAAALKEAGSIDGVLADKPLKFVRTADGKPALLVQDATKPSFTALGVVASTRNADVLQVSVRSAQLEAKRSLENGATLIRSKDEPSVRAFVQVSALQDLVQDSQGLSVNMPRKSEAGQVRAERLNVPRHMTVEGLGAMITASAGQVAERAERQAIGIQGGSDIGDQAVQKLRSFARKASSFLAELERLPTAQTPEEPARAARVYDIMDLS